MSEELGTVDIDSLRPDRDGFTVIPNARVPRYD